MNRREAVSILGGSIVAGEFVPSFARAAKLEGVTEHLFTLPLKPGDEVAAMTAFRDVVLLATRGGEIFQIQRFGDGPDDVEVSRL